MSVSDVRLCFSERERCTIRKDYMGMIMNVEHDLDHDVEGEAMEGPVDCII